MTIFWAILILTLTGIIGAIILVLAAKFMNVAEDERVAAVQEILPAANCGACGYAGCADYAKAIVNGEAVNKCVPGGAAVAQKAAAIMGVEAGEVVKRKAVVACQGNYNNTTDKYAYQGVSSCKAAANFYAGSSTCEFGCLGYGDCKAVCKFGAVSVENGLSSIDMSLCTGCGECVAACPKNIIVLRNESEKPIVLCANKHRGALTKQACTAGCIGCKKCEKVCPSDAIKVDNNVATINDEKCIGCGKCVEECPVHAIAVPKANCFRT